MQAVKSGRFKRQNHSCLLKVFAKNDADFLIYFDI